MKYYNPFYFSFLAFIVLLTTGCSSSIREKLIGKWKVNTSEITPSSAENSTLFSELNSMRFDIKDDGMQLHSNFFRTGALGSWELSKNQDSLICSYLYERATYTDSYAFSITEEELTLKTSAFETTDEVKIILVRQ